MHFFVSTILRVLGRRNGCHNSTDGLGVEGDRDEALVEGPVSASADNPAWKQAAESVETPNELCVGDIVKARYARSA